MPIIVTCCCGKNLEAPETAAGRHGKCSQCGRTVFVPQRTSQELVTWTGTDFQLLEAALHQELFRLPVQPTDRILDEAEKWAKVWKLPPERKPHHAGFDLICDMVSSCVMRDAAVGMDNVSVLRANGEQMVRVAVLRGERKLLHFIARSGEDEYLCWHHRDAEDDETETARERTDVLQSIATGVHCAKCDHNLGYVRVTKAGLAPIAGYRCGRCGRIFCSKCHGAFVRGCPLCSEGHEALILLAARLVPK